MTLAVKDGTWVWGRGASDCEHLSRRSISMRLDCNRPPTLITGKNNVIGLLTTFEHLLDPSNPEVFTPRRTIILAFGSDEESNGSYGAGQINKFLLERYAYFTHIPTQSMLSYTILSHSCLCSIHMLTTI